MDVVLHLLRYLCDNTCLGDGMYYSDFSRGMLHGLLSDCKDPIEWLVTFSNSSQNNNEDAGCSTVAFYILCMSCCIVDQISKFPDPVALLSAEAEYNEACLACLDIMVSLRMLLDELEKVWKSLVMNPFFLTTGV